MRIIETHAHLYLQEFEEDLKGVIENAVKNGVEKFYLPNIDEDSLDGMLSLCQKYPQYMFPMIGLHPCSVQKNYEEQLESIFNRRNEAFFCAVGEIDVVGFGLFPNPADAVVEIVLDDLLMGAEVRIHDMGGRLVRQARIQGKLARLDVSDLVPGIYTVEVSGSGARSIERLSIR